MKKPTPRPLDPDSLPAFAVYNNLIPGVKSYQDTNTSMAANAKGKKSRKRKLENQNHNSFDIGTQPSASASAMTNGKGNNGPIAQTQSKTKKRRNRKKKSKGTGTEPRVEVQEASTIATTDDAKESPSLEKKKKKKNKKPKDEDEVPPTLVNGTPNLKSHKVKVQVESKPSASKEIKSVPTKPQLVPNPVNPMWAKNSIKVQNKAKNAPIPKEDECPKLVPNPAAAPKSKISVATKPKPNSSAEVKYDKNTTPIPNLASILTKAPVVDSSIHGKSLFEWLIHPVPVTTFFDKYWEKQPLHIKRPEELSAYYSWILSSAQIDSVLRTNVIKFGKNLDITSYTDGVRETHNPIGRAMPCVVWDYYANGCSVRFLNPQTYVKPLWRLNASLQEYLGTFVGANVYLTPPDSQGFAPHYDDIEAFVLQIEGKKHWKLYKPRSKEEELPLYSSKNFKDEEIAEPILDVVLEEGDLLYFPRGMIHQARAVDGEHSLHITLSAYQLNTYADFLRLHLPIALEQSIEESVELRRGLPTDFLNYMGIVHSDSTEKNIVKKRKEFERKIKQLCEVVVNKPCDLAADQLGKKFIWDSLPPFLTKKEKPLTAHSDGEFLIDGQVFNRTEIEPDTEVKLLRKNCIRLVLEENALRLYYNIENSLEYHGEEAQFLEVPEEAGPAIDYLIAMYPAHVKVEDFPLDDITLKLQLAADMWEKGILITRNGLDPVDGNDMVLDSDLEEEDDSENGEEEDSDDMYENIEGDMDEDDMDHSDFMNGEYFDEEDEEDEDEEDEEDEVDEDDDDSFVYIPGTNPEVDALIASGKFGDLRKKSYTVNEASYVEELNSDEDEETKAKNQNETVDSEDEDDDDEDLEEECEEEEDEGEVEVIDLEGNDLGDDDEDDDSEEDEPTLEEEGDDSEDEDESEPDDIPPPPSKLRKKSNK